MNFSDYSYLLALPVERVFTPVEGWQFLLAEARMRFLIDELLIKNHLSTSLLSGEILEVDGGVSLLSTILAKHGVRCESVGLHSFLEKTDTGLFGLGISHNQLEHYNSINEVERVLGLMGERSSYGMVHQVHAADDPAFEWDREHHLRMKSVEWEEYFTNWAKRNQDLGWVYLGNHRGAPGRPKNFILERNGSLPFYRHYEEQTIRKIIAELSISNGISLARIPLVLLSFSLAKEKPYLLSALLGVVHALDALDGYAARKGLGSPMGSLFDISSDHIVEAIAMFKFAYDKGYTPVSHPWLAVARNISVDILRLYNAFTVGVGTPDAHPHEAFGTRGPEGQKIRALYGLTKAIGDMAMSIVPQFGIYISGVHIAASLARAMSVWTSPTSQKIYKEILDMMLTGRRNKRL